MHSRSHHSYWICWWLTKSLSGEVEEMRPESDAKVKFCCADSG